MYNNLPYCPRKSSLKTPALSILLSALSPRSTSLVLDNHDVYMLEFKSKKVWVHISNIVAIFENRRVLVSISNNISPCCACQMEEFVHPDCEYLFSLCDNSFDEFVRDNRFMIFASGAHSTKVAVQTVHLLTFKNNVIDLGPRARFCDTTVHDCSDASLRLYLQVVDLSLSVSFMLSSTDKWDEIDLTVDIGNKTKM